MNKLKIAITMDQALLKSLDELLLAGRFLNRSQAVEEAVNEMITRIQKTRLAAQCALLYPRTESELAEEGMPLDAEEWPEY